MSTGTGIFLAGLFIGLVMLYGETKDRWDWEKFARKFGIYFGIAIYVIFFFTYHTLNNWKAFDIDWSLKGIFYIFLTVIVICVIAILPHVCAQQFYEKILDKNFEFDDEWNERLVYKITHFLFAVIFFTLLTFYTDDIKEYLIHYFNKPKS
jgi:uncharacterized membrane protein YbhN (UPF0104 family)